MLILFETHYLNMRAYPFMDWLMYSIANVEVGTREAIRKELQLDFHVVLYIYIYGLLAFRQWSHKYWEQIEEKEKESE